MIEQPKIFPENEKLKNKNVIVGKGMVAGALKDLTGWENDILFASGVSNSGETDKSSFQKEIELVRSHLSGVLPASTFVYFSTTSIFDVEKSSSQYIHHKLHIEEMIRNSGVNYLIVRLPNLVGKSLNPHTLTNFFAHCIRLNLPVRLKTNAMRHLIDVADLIPILNDIAEKFGKQKVTVNVETDKPLSAGEILKMMEVAVSKKADIHQLTGESKLSKSVLPEIFPSNSYVWITGKNYHIDLFRKYYSS